MFFPLNKGQWPLTGKVSHACTKITLSNLCAQVLGPTESFSRILGNIQHPRTHVGKRTRPLPSHLPPSIRNPMRYSDSSHTLLEALIIPFTGTWSYLWNNISYETRGGIWLEYRRERRIKGRLLGKICAWGIGVS